jgi:hypothetical protein
MLTRGPGLRLAIFLGDFTGARTLARRLPRHLWGAGNHLEPAKCELSFAAVTDVTLVTLDIGFVSRKN